MNKNEKNIDLSKIKEKDLIKLIEETKKIREELGDNPEIKEIEDDIIKLEHNSKVNLTMQIGFQLLKTIAFTGASAYMGLNTNFSFDLSNATNLVTMLLLITNFSSYLEFYHIASDDYKKRFIEKDISLLKEKIKYLRLKMESEKIDEKSKTDMNISIDDIIKETNKNEEDDINVKRR